jgi:hypothetical protein
MHIQELLQTITDRNAPVLGCIARSGDKMFHNLDDFGLDCEKIAESVEDLFHLTTMLDDEEAEPLTVIFAEYDGHSLVGQRVDDGLMVAVADHLQRGAYKKLQVGLSMQARMMSKALANAPATVATPAPAAAPVPETTSGPVPANSAFNAFRALGSLLGTVSEAPKSEIDEAEMLRQGKRKRVYRGQVYWD